MASSPQLPQGWEITTNGLSAFKKETARFAEALSEAGQAKTKARGSTSLDAPDCIEASRFLLTGVAPSQWKIWLRVVAAICFIVAGVMITNGFATPGDLLLLIGGGMLAVLVLILQETLLR